MQAVRSLALAAALVAVLMLAASGPGTRLGLWEWQMAFKLMKWAMFAGFGAAAVALLLLIFPRTRGQRPKPLFAALLLGLMAGAPLVALLMQSKQVPYIHDVTTDTRDPPSFVALEAARRASPNGLAYGGAEVAAAQQSGYPHIRSLVIAAPPAQAFARALETARAMGWEIAGSDASSGRIEATATTLWFGFKDDVVVRIRPEGAGSRIDVRSVSRVGQSDVGANARRIQDYLSRLT